MIERTNGNLLNAPAEALVNTVNTVGVMGKGIALQFKKIYPENFKAYKRACEAELIQPGRVFTYDLASLDGPRYIINVPTKRHWKGKAKIEDVESGLKALVEEVKRLGIKSIAVPPLGCGNGGLDWAEVAPLIEEAFKPLTDVRVLLFEPSGAIEAESVKAPAKRPNWTVTRAVIVGLIKKYLSACFDPFVTLLEVHKLGYFAQVAGEDLKLDFAEGPFGPYADKIRFVLNHTEGHFLQGVGDGRTSPTTPIKLLPGAAREAESFLENHSGTQERFARVAELIEGFETSYGMELLASVHWVATQKDPRARTDVNAAIDGVRAWTERKARLFSPTHIEVAWNRLKEQGWL